jgi:hypothetical protein
MICEVLLTADLQQKINPNQNQVWAVNKWSSGVRKKTSSFAFFYLC